MKEERQIHKYNLENMAFVGMITFDDYLKETGDIHDVAIGFVSGDVIKAGNILYCISKLNIESYVYENHL